MRMFYEALQPGGLLVMEHTQKLPDGLARFFQQVAPYAQVYRKLEPAFVGHEAETSIPRRHVYRRVDAFRDGSHPHFNTAPSNHQQAEP